MSTSTSSYRRFVRHEEDIDRLPHGMIRTGYDANTRQYTFHDNTTGVQFISAPGESYGTLLPTATANYVNPKRGEGRKLTLQAYDRPVFFADDAAQVPQSTSRSSSRGHKSAPSTPVSRSPTTPSSAPFSAPSSPTGHTVRSATFADILPAHLIDTAASTPVERKRTVWPRSPSKSPTVAVVHERGHSDWPDEKRDRDSLDEKGVEPVSRQYPGEKKGPRDALRSTARVLGRSLTTVRGHRSRERKRDDDGYVLV